MFTNEKSGYQDIENNYSTDSDSESVYQNGSLGSNSTNTTASGAPSKNKSRGRKKRLHLIPLLLLLAGLYFDPLGLFTCSYDDADANIKLEDISFSPYVGASSKKTELCPIYEKAVLTNTSASQFILNDPGFRNFSATRLSKAVQIPTWVDDKITDFSKFAKFHKFLENEFKHVYAAASNIYHVNEYGLIWEFKGSDESLKPLLFMAHQDTVPLNDPKDWKYHPLSGYYDGTNIYGRGSSDCKNLLIGLLETFDFLIKDGFLKGGLKRTILLSSGFDEENSGYQGAGNLAKFLVEKYGEDSIDHIIDEGTTAYTEAETGAIGVIATGEKGHFDAVVEVTAPGGHSSIPRDHTAIGYLSQFLARYETEKYSPILPNYNPFLGTLQCIAEHSTTFPKSLRKDILTAHTSKKSNKKVVKHFAKDLFTRYLLQTSQAIDIIIGGDKANSLPQNATALINHRITFGNDAETIWDKLTGYGYSVADQYGLGLEVNGIELIDTTPAGKITIRAFEAPLPVAPITPIKDDIWINLSSHLRAFYEDIVYPEHFEDGSVFVTSPGIMTGNTDTKWYWKLTDHIFRFEPGNSALAGGIHGLNEYVAIDSHLQIIAFYYHYIKDYC